MSQLSFSDAEFTGKRKQARRDVFLAEMDVVIQWVTLAALSEPAMNKPLHVSMSMRQFWDLGLTQDSLLDKAANLNFRHLLERNPFTGRLLAEVSAMLSEQGLLLRQGTIAGDPHQRRQLDQEYRSTGGVVWACQFVDGATTIAGADGAGASVTCKKARICACEGPLRLTIDSFHRATFSYLHFLMNSHAPFAGHSGLP